jgi:hypothetical protein
MAYCSEHADREALVYYIELLYSDNQRLLTKNIILVEDLATENKRLLAKIKLLEDEREAKKKPVLHGDRKGRGNKSNVRSSSRRSSPRKR